MGILVGNAYPKSILHPLKPSPTHNTLSVSVARRQSPFCSCVFPSHCRACRCIHRPLESTFCTLTISSNAAADAAGTFGRLRTCFASFHPAESSPRSSHGTYSSALKPEGKGTHNKIFFIDTYHLASFVSNSVACWCHPLIFSLRAS